MWTGVQNRQIGGELGTFAWFPVGSQRNRKAGRPYLWWLVDGGATFGGTARESTHVERWAPRGSG